jgi:hypothetical protein
MRIRARVVMLLSRIAACGFANEGTLSGRNPEEARPFIREAASGDLIAGSTKGNFPAASRNARIARTRTEFC